MAIVDGSLQLGYKDSAWFTANPTLILKQGQIVALEQTGTYKLGDGVTQLSALTFLGGGDTVDVNTIGAAINGATSATPNDTDLVMSVDTSVAKKNTWTQIKAFFKTYFDTVYATITDLTGYVKKGTLTTNTIPKATASDTIGNSQITDDGTNVGIVGNIQIGGVADARLYIKNANGNYYFAVENGGGLSIFYINPNGRVSIGTLQDIYKLKVDGSFASATIVDDGANVGINTLPSEKLHVNGNIRCDNLTASQIVETDASKNLVSAAKGTAYNKNFGTGTTNVPEIGATLANSNPLITNSTGKLITSDWIDYSSTSITGWSSTTVKSIKYLDLGNSFILTLSINGTSNATSATFTLPFTINSHIIITPCYVINNGASQTGCAIVLANSNTINFYQNISQATFTASGTKAINLTITFAK